MLNRPIAAGGLAALALAFLPAGPHAPSAAAAMLAMSATSATAATAAPSALPTGFVETRVADKLNGATAMTIAPDGRVFIAEQRGTVRVVENDVLLAEPVLTVATTAIEDLGLQGITVGPDFESSPSLYVLATVDEPTTHNRILRYKVTGNDAPVESAQVIADLETLTTRTRVGGGLHFGADGMLYVGTGDNGDGAKAASLESTLGKILRLAPDGHIPPDNPFFATQQGRNRAIWASGLRNPFTFAVQPGTGRMLINDIGQAAFEEINEGAAGEDYGWPSTEGPTSAPGITGPLYAYPHVPGCAISGGAFYNPADAWFPPSYVGKYFFADYCQGEIRVLDPNNPTDVTVFGSTSAPSWPIDVRVSPDGALYYLARGSDFGTDTGALYKVRYVGSGQPTIGIQPVATSVVVGRTARFSVRAFGTQPLTYRWQRDGVDVPGGTGAELAVGPVQPSDSGARFSVIVGNGEGSVSSDAALLTVTERTPPVATILLPNPGFQFVGDGLVTFYGQAVDALDVPLPPSALSWRMDLHHGDHVHELMPTTAGIAGGTHMLDLDAHRNPDAFVRITFTARDSEGLVTVRTRDIQPVLVDLMLASDPPGITLSVDDAPVTTPATVPSIAGVRRTVGADALERVGGALYAFERWSDGGDAIHTTPPMSRTMTLTATFRLFGGSLPIVDWGGDYVDADAGFRGADAPVESDLDLERDGVYDDERWSIEWSDATPLSPPVDRAGKSARFYGGLLIESYDRPFEYKWAQVWAQSPVKPLDKLYYGASPGTRGWDLRYWRKSDFLSGGHDRRVSFDEASSIALVNYEGGDGVPQNNSGQVRIVVKDGGQWFISERAGEPASQTASLIITNPRNTGWALYDPQPPLRLAFKPRFAQFEPHVFVDIQAVGYLHSNDAVPPPAADVRAGFTVERVHVTARLGDPATALPPEGPTLAASTPATAPPTSPPTETPTVTPGPSPTATRTLLPGETPPPTDTAAPTDTPPPGSTTARPPASVTPTFTVTSPATRTPTRRPQGDGGTVYLPIGYRRATVAGVPVQLAENGPPVRADAADVAHASHHSEDRQPVLVVLRPAIDVARRDVPDDVAMTAVAQAQDRVLADVDASDVTLRHRYGIVPMLFVDASARGRAALARHPLVAAVEPDRVSVLQLAEHAQTVHADRVWADYGVTGEGVNVAVIDTGVDANHPDLKDAIVAQKCFSVESGCGVNSAASESDDAIDRNGHGTGMAGIVAGRGVVAPRGIAPGAGIVAVRVFNAKAESFISDQVKAFDWIVRERSRLNVKIANMSLGSRETFTGNCDQADPARATAIQTAITRGIAVFVATGNSGAQNALSAPGCLSNVIAVAATYDADLGREPDRGEFGGPDGCFDENASPDTVTCFSNIGRGVSVVAPGAWTTAPKMGGGTSSTVGTSNASPVAAAVGALVVAVDGNIRPAQLKKLLEDTGTLVTAKNGQKYPRVDALAALIKAGAKPVTPAGPTASPTPTRGPTASATPTAAPSETPVAGSPTAVASATMPAPSATPSPPDETPVPTRTEASATITPFHGDNNGPSIYLPVASNGP